jgi:RimJ/RimL family protein N-acetyltransferase
MNSINDHFKVPLQTSNLYLKPSIMKDLESLYEIGSDPEVWSMHSEKDRYNKDKFYHYFISGLNNNLGAFTLTLKNTQEVVGFTRYYDYEQISSSVKIGYTFLSKVLWGKGINQEVKKAMISHAFEVCDKVIFEVFENNYRSQRAVLKLGAVEIEPKGDRKCFVVFQDNHLVV